MIICSYIHLPTAQLKYNISQPQVQNTVSGIYEALSNFLAGLKFFLKEALSLTLETQRKENQNLFFPRKGRGVEIRKSFRKCIRREQEITCHI